MTNIKNFMNYFKKPIFSKLRIFKNFLVSRVLDFDVKFQVVRKIRVIIFDSMNLSFF